ncbi:amidase [Caenimonas aquaedulcis]|uniref:Amidase n=1 Tax=Caenimonas aquaedulcis TaxID=2793270 RepID=A0A931H484_9BURK|nr:amidase [Caenimonas aquaedulcis]MBG9388289.1 amidase [Caenimonas aquaedulcis]
MDIARIRQEDRQLHAFASLQEDAAVQRAQSAAQGPLAGRLVAVKDIFDTADLPTAYGSAIYARHRPASEAAMVGIIRRAGGVIVGKSVTTEFAYLQPAATLNPAAHGCTPGGSSAGSAAAVAAGMVPLAIGSQTGGSTVRPASYCGIAGFKPGFDLLPTSGMKAFSWSLDTVGLFARTVGEVAEFAQAVSGGRIAAPLPASLRRWSVGVPRAYPWGEISQSGQQAMGRAISALRAAGANVVSCDLPAWVGEAFTAHDAIQGWEASRALRREMEEHAAMLSPLLREYLAGAMKVSDAQYADAQATAGVARARGDAWFDGIDVLLTPSAPDEPPEGFGSTGASTFNRAWTLLGTPCLSVPGATGIHGRPMGLQVIAPRGLDSLCLAAGAFLEGALSAFER